MPFNEEDYNNLARNNLNGRQVRTPMLKMLTAMLIPIDQKHHPHCAGAGRQQ
jgi:hypothetical protein